MLPKSPSKKTSSCHFKSSSIMAHSLDSPSYSLQGRLLSSAKVDVRQYKSSLRKSGTRKFNTHNLRFGIKLSCTQRTYIPQYGNGKWLSGKDSNRGGGNSLHTASHSMNEAIVAAGGTQTWGNVPSVGVKEGLGWVFSSPQWRG